MTRAPEQARALVSELEALGAEVLLLPTLSFRDPEDTEALDAALRSVARFDWILFTSANAVRFFSERCRSLGLDCRRLQSPRPMVGVVGPATARVAGEEGFRVDYVTKQTRGVALAEELWGSISGRWILLPRSDRAGNELPTALREAAAQVVDLVAYRAMAATSSTPEVLQRLEGGELDVVTFASPSAFDYFSDMLGTEAVARIAGRAVFAAIGPTTAQAIRSEGYPVSIEAAESNSAGLAAAIANYFVDTTSGVKKS